MAGLHRGPQLKRTLEDGLPDGHRILTVSASVLTGTILVKFRSDLQLAIIIARLEVLVLRFSETGSSSRESTKS